MTVAKHVRVLPARMCEQREEASADLLRNAGLTTSREDCRDLLLAKGVDSNHQNSMSLHKQCAMQQASCLLCSIASHRFRLNTCF